MLSPEKNPAAQQEMQSSAVTLSDMEVFIFPRLMYALVLANIMSPKIWRWRDDPWFKDIQKMNLNRKVQRIKQYIMDHYSFNLDLETWGLTETEKELNRFRAFVSPEALAQSNALFGYEGDKYYFDIDIRRHFGLDKYAGNIIPYWKTETIEAMDAFIHRPGYSSGAGECVSLSALYSAALFIIGGISLNDIFMLATPLHSQNFIMAGDGILTNNRRLVTKTMWCNGTALSGQARRALEHETVTHVGHVSGYIHTLYEDATIDPGQYAAFSDRISAFLTHTLTAPILGNFLRAHPEYQNCFQLAAVINGHEKFIPLERAFAYENGNAAYKLTDDTRDKLLSEADAEEFFSEPISDRVLLNTVELFLDSNPVDVRNKTEIEAMKKQCNCGCLKNDNVLTELINFCMVIPRLPLAASKGFSPDRDKFILKSDMSREEIISHITALRPHNLTADLAWYAYRDARSTDFGIYLKTALQRNPVCLNGKTIISAEDVQTCITLLNSFASESIYDGPGRIAQPDEVWNFRRGDGIEKALLLLVYMVRAFPDEPILLHIIEERISVEGGRIKTDFLSTKQLPSGQWNIREYT